MHSRRVFLRIGLVLGTLLTYAPLLGFLGTFFGMNRAMRLLGQNGISDPHALAQIVSGTLLMTASGIVLFPCGVVLLVVCFLSLRRGRSAEPPPLPRYPDDPTSARTEDGRSSGGMP